MQRSRRLTHAERWELGLFLSMLIVGCLCLTAILNIHNLPRLFAATEKPSPPASPATDASYFATASGATVTPAPTVLEPIADPILTAPPTPEQPAPTITDKNKTKKTAAAYADIKVYKGEKYRYVRTLRLRVTAYAPDARCCWPYPGTTTATGLSVKTNRGRLVAADPRIIPMHALVSVPGYSSGAPVPVLDQGGAIKGHRLDVMLPTFDAAKDWGSRLLDVKIYEPMN